MVADAVGGPRGKSPLTADERDYYDNLILLCRNHHSEIDSQENTYPVDLLRQIKSDHELWVRQSLPGYDTAKQRDDEIYAGYIDEWERRCDLDNWTAWSSWVLSGGQPSLSVDVDEQLFELRRWLLVRVWPNRYPSLEKALSNFARVLSDFQNVFRERAERPHPGSDMLLTVKFYRIKEWNTELYERLGRQYDYHVDLLEDLMLELTRAANHVCDEVRAQLLPSFHLKEGRVSVMSGPHGAMQWREMVVQYDREQTSADWPYPGLPDFLTVRATHDRYFGQGTLPS
jgi:hypothetical protein